MFYFQSSSLLFVLTNQANHPIELINRFFNMRCYVLSNEKSRGCEILAQNDKIDIKYTFLKDIRVNCCNGK